MGRAVLVAAKKASLRESRARRFRALKEKTMINENRVAARTLIIAAHDFLVEYMKHDDWDVVHHELAAAAADAVFSASFVDSAYKHDLLAAVRDKIQPGRPGYTQDNDGAPRMNFLPL
jgi:hypothetical protein